MWIIFLLFMVAPVLFFGSIVVVEEAWCYVRNWAKLRRGEPLEPEDHERNWRAFS